MILFEGVVSGRDKESERGTLCVVPHHISVASLRWMFGRVQRGVVGMNDANDFLSLGTCLFWEEGCWKW